MVTVTFLMEQHVWLCKVNISKNSLEGYKQILHFHLGVVDEIFQRVSTGIIIFELSIVGDYSRGWIIRAHDTTDINCLNVGEVSKDPRASCTGGLEATLMVESSTEKKKRA